MSESTNTLRPAKNNVSMQGILKEKKLEIKRGEKGEYISGYLVLMANDGEHKVRCFENKLDDNKKETSAFKGLNRVKNEYVSVADLMLPKKNGFEEEPPLTVEQATLRATKVKVDRGQLSLNEYFDDGGNLVSSPQISARYFSRVEDADSFTPKANFEIEGFFESIVPEFKGDTATGRLILNLIVPLYKGHVIPLQLVTTEQAGAYIQNHYEVNRTGTVFGSIINSSVKTTVVTKGFLKDEVSEAHTARRELLVENGLPEQLDEESNDAFHLEDIQSAMRVREVEDLPNIKIKQQKREEKKRSPAGEAGMFSLARNPAPPKDQPTFSKY